MVFILLFYARLLLVCKLKLCSGFNKKKDIGLKLNNSPDWPITYNSDGLITIHNSDFVNEAKFKQAYELGISTGHSFGEELHIEWRVFVACWAGAHAKNLQGDFVECGVNTGIISRAVIDYINFDSMRDRTFYLLDTFAGIPVAQLNENEVEMGIPLQNNTYFDCYDLVCDTFADFSNVRIIKGTVPDTLPLIESEAISYVSIDMNCVFPEIAAGEYLWSKIVTGGVILLDDYGWKPHINQKNAWDSFAEKKSVKILPLPTGQGMIIKP